MTAVWSCCSTPQAPGVQHFDVQEAAISCDVLDLSTVEHRLASKEVLINAFSECAQVGEWVGAQTEKAGRHPHAGRPAGSQAGRHMNFSPLFATRL